MRAVSAFLNVYVTVLQSLVKTLGSMVSAWLMLQAARGVEAALDVLTSRRRMAMSTVHSFINQWLFGNHTCGVQHQQSRTPSHEHSEREQGR